MKREGSVSIPNIPSQALEPITNKTNINSPFLWTANTLFLDEAAVGADNLSEKLVYRIAGVVKSLLGQFSPQLWKPWLERPREKWRTLHEIIFLQQSRPIAFEAVNHRLRQVISALFAALRFDKPAVRQCGVRCLYCVWLIMMFLIQNKHYSSLRTKWDHSNH